MTRCSTQCRCLYTPRTESTRLSTSRCCVDKSQHLVVVLLVYTQQTELTGPGTWCRCLYAQRSRHVSALGDTHRTRWIFVARTTPLLSIDGSRGGRTLFDDNKKNQCQSKMPTCVHVSPPDSGTEKRKPSMSIKGIGDFHANQEATRVQARPELPASDPGHAGRLEGGARESYQRLLNEHCSSRETSGMPPDKHWGRAMTSTRGGAACM